MPSPTISRRGPFHIEPAVDLVGLALDPCPFDCFTIVATSQRHFLAPDGDDNVALRDTVVTTYPHFGITFGDYCLKSDLRRAKDVMDLERLVDLIEPFGPVGCAAAAALIDRQFQLAQQARDLFPRHHMLHARASAERLIKVVKRSQAAWEKLAINLALGKTVDRAAAEPERQLI